MKQEAFPRINLAASFVVLAVFLAWIWSLSPVEPASSPIKLVLDPIESQGPEDLGTEDYEGPVVRLLFGGDIMQHRRQMNDDFQASYADLSTIVGQADLAVANLEFPVVPSRPLGPPPGSIRFNGSVSHLEALAGTGFDVLVTANNHAFDQGLEGLTETLSQIDRAGMIPLGTAESVDDLEQIRIFDIGLKVAMIAYTYTINPRLEATGEPVFPPRDLPVFTLNFSEWNGRWREQGLEMFRKHSRAARELGADVLVAVCHWGEEWHFQPTPDQRLAARDLVDSGFDLVVGSHSHVIQGAEVYRDTPIAYSLGNLNSDFRPWETRTGALLEVELAADGTSRGRVVNFSYHPTFVDLDGHRVRLLTGSESGESQNGWNLAAQVLGPSAVRAP